MYKIAALNKISEEGLSLLNEHYQTTEDPSQANGILVRSQDMHSMELPNDLLAVARAGAGVNNIPIDKCTKEGIVVFNTPGANANAVKELTLTGLFLASRDVVQGVSWASSLTDDIAKQVEKGKSRFAGVEISGKTIGVVGLGAIGVLVANAASALGMKVLGYDPYLSVKAALELTNSIEVSESLEAMIGKCHYVSVHVPYMDATKGIISASLIGQMMAGASILNFSRDALVDEDALLSALDAGKLHRYVTDFPNDKVAGHDKVVALPHLGASTKESEENCARMAVNQMMDYLENGNITNSVNYPSCSMGVCTTAGRIAVLHENIPSMIGKISSHMASLGINISDMTNRSRGQYQYTLLDADSSVASGQFDELRAMDGIISVRVVK